MSPMAGAEIRPFLTALFEAAVAAADPEPAIRRLLPERPRGRTIVLGAGKAAAPMAAIFDRLWDGPLEGVVIDRHGAARVSQRIGLMTSAHPEPDQAGMKASAELLRRVEGLTEDDLVVMLVSGGGSALLPAPPGGLGLDDELAVNRALLASGAPISAMNILRKHVSRIKGGRLAQAAAPARVVSFVVSDIPGDDPALVASGPTVPGAGTLEDARAIVRQWRLDLPARVIEHLERDEARAPMPDDPAFARNEVHVVAAASMSLEAAAAVARSRGVEAHILTDALEGEAGEAGRFHAALARQVAMRGQPFSRPCLLLSGGETTVTLTGAEHGEGGRNTEFLLAFALAIEGMTGIDAIAADTDGIDGSRDNAGAFADGATAAKLRNLGHDPRQFLARHDAWNAFRLCDGLFVPGPTGTNVNDFRAILIR